MTSNVPVEIPSDPDDTTTAVAVSPPPALAKRPRAALAAAAAATTSDDFLAAFWPSPPLPKRRPPASPILLLDDTPTPPKRPRPISPEPRPSIVAETPQSIVPCSLASGAVVPETPGSLVPCSSFDAVVAETPGLVVPCSLGGPTAAGLSCASSRKLSEVSCLISLESDDELTDTGYREPVKKLPSNTSKSEHVLLSGTSSSSDKVDSLTGTTNFEQFLSVGLPSEDSALQDDDVFTKQYSLQDGGDSEAEGIDRGTSSTSEGHRNSAETAARKGQQNEDKARVLEEREWKQQEDQILQKDNVQRNKEKRQRHQEERGLQKEESAQLNEGRKQKQQEEKRRQKDENARLIEERKRKQQEEKRLKMSEKVRLIEERKQKRQEDKFQKEAMKAQLAEMKRLDKEKKKWESGKIALKSIVAEIDSKVIESGSIGGHLLSRFAEKGLSFRIMTNPIKGSILWRMNVPDQIAQHQASGTEVPYILVVHQAEEFCDLVSSRLFLDHVHKVQSQYPTFTICYLTNKLTSYIKKCEQSQYKNPSNSSNWRRPPVEEVLCKLTTHYTKVHSRQCIDEAEVAEHIVGLTASLANCQFRKKMTWLSVHANGSIIPKDFIDKDLFKKNTWLKALLAIPKVQPRHALAIWKKYPTMRSLMNVYIDPTRTVHEKEFLLKDLRMEGLLGNEDRRLGEVCSKRVYRILMAQNGGMKTDDAENGADFFGV